MRALLNPRAPIVNVGVVLARFAEVLGADCLRLVSFNEVLERQEDLFVHFCRSLPRMECRSATRPWGGE